MIQVFSSEFCEIFQNNFLKDYSERQRLTEKVTANSESGVFGRIFYLSFRTLFLVMNYGKKTSNHNIMVLLKLFAKRCLSE